MRIYLFTLALVIVYSHRPAMAVTGSTCNWHVETLTDSIESPAFREIFYQGHVTTSSGAELLGDLNLLKAHKNSPEITKLIKNLETVDYDYLKLTAGDQEVLWREVIHPRLQVNDEVLKLAAKDGDEVAELALKVPYGKRDEFIEVATLMKNIDANKSRSEIASELADRYKGCLK